MRIARVWVVALLVLGVLGVGAVKAEALVFELNQVFSGWQPVGSAPWLRATFTQQDTDTVQLTLQNLVSSGSGQFVTEWDFNSSATILSIQRISGETADSVAYDPNHFQADGDGLYDIGFVFASAGGSRFSGGEFSVYEINCSGPCAEAAFNLLSQPAGGAGPFTTAAHIQGIPGGCSGWVGDSAAGGAGSSNGTCGAVPEPGTLLLLGSGLIGVAAFGRRFFRLG